MERRSRLWSMLVASLVAAAGCPEPGYPAYTRPGGPAPRLDGLTAPATLVVFWASWCPPCREELPGLRALARNLPAGLALATYGEDEDDAQARELLGEAPPPELGYRRDVGKVAARAFGVDALPAAFLVADGQLVARLTGPMAWNSRGMRSLLAKLASERSGSSSSSRPARD